MSQYDSEKKNSADSALHAALASRYEILSEIGAGGWSTVYKARDLTLNQLVAIKVLHSHLALSTALLQRFEQEARTAGALNHPGIVRIIDYGTLPHPHIIMEYVEGSALSDEIKKGELTVGMIITIAVAVCGALHHAHQLGIVHRDIKPSNILLTSIDNRTIHAKVVDFGLSKAIESDGTGGALTRTGEALGSPPYMSPEQWSGKGVDARADIYSLGCLLYEALTGRQAFPGASAVECMNKHLSTCPEAIQAIKPNMPEAESLNTIVFHCLEKDPARRYQAVTLIAEDLEKALAGQKLAHAGSHRTSFIEWLKWRRLLLSRLATALFVTASLCLLLLYLNRQTILDTIWDTNYKSGEKALQMRDFATADAKFSTALKALDLSGLMDNRYFWTLEKMQPVFNQEKNGTNLLK